MMLIDIHEQQSMKLRWQWPALLDKDWGIAGNESAEFTD